MIEHNFLQFWSFIFSLVSLGLISAMVGIKLFLTIKTRRANTKAAEPKDAFTCTVCNEEIKEADFDKHDTSLFLALKKLGTCEPCLRGEKPDKRNFAQKAVEAIDNKANTTEQPQQESTLRKTKVLKSSEDDKQPKAKVLQ